jgi:hypothetical protein
MQKVRITLAYSAILAVHTIFLFGLLLLWVLYGRRKAYYKMSWMLHSFIEWLSGEGRFRRADKYEKVPDGEQVRRG